MNLQSIDIRGNPFYFRDKTSDSAIIKSVLIDRSEYHLPKTDPKVIVDIGANIGVTAVLFSVAYPNAEIHCYEPHPVNYEILLKNSQPYKNLVLHQFALGNFNGEALLKDSNDPTNYAGYSFHDGRQVGTRVKVVRASDALLPLGQIDIMKLDCEGSEYEIFQDFADHVTRAEFIMGEMHGNNDFKILDLLYKDFFIGVTKSLDQQFYLFYAQRRGQPRG